MTALIRAELRSRIKSLVAIALGTFLFLFVTGSSYEAFGGAGMPARFFEGRPPRAFTAFSGSRTTDLFSPKHYLAFGFNHPLFLALTLGVAVAIGGRSIAGDVETARAELLYSRPAPRSRLLLAHALLWLGAQTTVIAVGVAGAMLGARFSPDLRAADVEWGLVRVGIQYFGVAAVFAGVAFAASALFRTRGGALALAVGAVALCYLVNYVALVWDSAEWASKLTPFGYYAPLEVSSGSLALGDIAVLLGVTVLLFVVADMATERRDLA